MKLCMGCMNQVEDNVTTCPYCGYNETADEQEAYYLAPGTIIGGKYIVGKAMGYGGFTVSYIGMDAEKNRKVTIKEYLPSDLTTRSQGENEITIYSGDALQQFEEGLSTFLNEGNQIQQLGDLSGIATVYDCVSENDTGYIISEHLDGKTLKQIVEEGKIFSAEETKQFASILLSGLEKLHQVHVIHCDIAPENIVITEDSQIKLVDFGAIRYAATSNSKSLAIILKQGFAPEEQYRSRGEKGAWSDVYSVAAVLYYMLTGKVPEESVERALTDKLQEPSKLGVELPQGMENAIMNALNVFQKDRTPSAEMFLRELESSNVKRNKVKIKSDTGKFPVWAKCTVAALLCVALAGGIYVAKNMNTEVQVTENKDSMSMLNVTGKSLDEAQQVLKNAGFSDPVIVYKLGEDEETVSLQTPNAGTIIQKDSEIVLYVKNNSKLTLNKDVQNISESDIKKLRRQLKSIGVTLEADEKQENSEIQRNNLISIKQNGEEFDYGNYVEADSKLTFVISKGSKAKSNQTIPATYIHKKYEDIKQDTSYMIQYENAKDNCVPKPMQCFGDGSVYGEGEIAYQTLEKGDAYKDDFALYEISEVVSSAGYTKEEFENLLTEKYGMDKDNITVSNVGETDTDYQWTVTDSGISGLSAQKNCFSANAKIKIWKDVATPTPAVTENSSSGTDTTNKKPSSGNSSSDKKSSNEQSAMDKGGNLE